MQLSTPMDALPATISLAQPDSRKAFRRAIPYGLVVTMIALLSLPLALTGNPPGNFDSFTWLLSRWGMIISTVCLVGCFLLIYLGQRFGMAHCRLRGTRLIFGRWASFETEIEIDNIRSIEARGQMGSVLCLDTSHGLGIILEDPVVYRGSSACRWSTRLKHRLHHCHVFFPDIVDKTPQELAAAIMAHAWSMGAGAPPVYARNYAGRRPLPMSQFLPECEIAENADLEADPGEDAVCCRGCGYDLRASRASSVCPECGGSVAMSMQEESLAFADRRWLKTMRAGALLFSAAAGTAAGAAFLPALFAAAAIDGAISGRQMIMLTSWSWAMLLLPAIPAVHLLGRRDPTILTVPPKGAFEPWIRRIAWSVLPASVIALKTIAPTFPGMMLLGWLISLLAPCGFWRIRALLLQSGGRFSAAVSVLLQFILWMVPIAFGAAALLVAIMVSTGAAMGSKAGAPPRAAPTDATVFIYLALPAVAMCTGIAVLSLRAAVMVRRELARRSRVDSTPGEP